MNNTYITEIKISILLLTVLQLFFTSCSKKVYPEPAPRSIVILDDKQSRKDFDDVAIKMKPQKLPDFSFNRLSEQKPFQNISSSEDQKKLEKFIDERNRKEIHFKDCNADQIIATAQKFIGIPYCMGGTTSKCMDCSGLVLAVFAKHGIQLPHSSEEQARYGKVITTIDGLIKGDLVFFIKSYKTSRFITHAGIYIGNNEFIHSSSKNGVTVSSLNYIWWSKKFIFGTRLL